MFVASIWMFAIVMTVVLMLIGAQVSNGRGGPPPIVFLTICAGLFGIAHPVLVRPELHEGRHGQGQAVAGQRRLRQRDIGSIQIHEPGTGALTYTSDLEYASKMAFRNAVASQNHWVTFDYGARLVLLAGKLTGAQADRVGSEIATWLGA